MRTSVGFDDTRHVRENTDPDTTSALHMAGDARRLLRSGGGDALRLHCLQTEEPKFNEVPLFAVTMRSGP